jgi:hypothetical protein
MYEGNVKAYQLKRLDFLGGNLQCNKNDLLCIILFYFFVVASHE